MQTRRMLSSGNDLVLVSVAFGHQCNSTPECALRSTDLSGCDWQTASQGIALHLGLPLPASPSGRRLPGCPCMIVFPGSHGVWHGHTLRVFPSSLLRGGAPGHLLEQWSDFEQSHWSCIRPTMCEALILKRVGLVCRGSSPCPTFAGVEQHRQRQQGLCTAWYVCEFWSLPLLRELFGSGSLYPTVHICCMWSRGTWKHPLVPASRRSSWCQNLSFQCCWPPSCFLIPYFHAVSAGSVS